MPNAPRPWTEGRRCFRRRSFEPPPETTALYERILCYMRLPHDLVESPLFQFREVDELLAALGDRSTPQDAVRIRHLIGLGLPPIASADALAAMIGLNAGIVWSFLKRPNRHYRTFSIPKGRGQRDLVAPKVGIKIVQTWIAFHLSRAYQAPDHVFGFVRGKSHTGAALCHTGANWAYSVDIEDFFPSTPIVSVRDALLALGYDPQSADLIATLCTLNGRLPQGAPTSPTLSNLCFAAIDARLRTLAAEFGCIVTRYADDIVFSGQGNRPDALQLRTHQLFEGTPYRIAPHKELVQPLKGRIKIHGLLIKHDGVRLTKGYRNRLRAYNHIAAKLGTSANDFHKIRGHLQYGNLISSLGYAGDHLPGIKSGLANNGFGSATDTIAETIPISDENGVTPSSFNEANVLGLRARIRRFFKDIT